MQKIKEYKNTIFAVETLKQSNEKFDQLTKDASIRSMRTLHGSLYEKRTDEYISSINVSQSMRLRLTDSLWDYNSENEFFADYRKYNPFNPEGYFLLKRERRYGYDLTIESSLPNNTKITVRVCDLKNERDAIEAIFDIFETDASKSKLPYELLNKPKIFIGHGRNNLWRDLKDHLQDKQGYEIVAYEVGARAGHAIRDILTDMLSESSFALLIMTAEDETVDGQFRARQNVIHEIGLFQGKLGFNRAVILLEDGTEEFSNIQGIEQIRFSKGNIKETYGEVLATIKREFH